MGSDEGMVMSSNQPQQVEADARLARIERYLKLVEKYGFATVIYFVGMYAFVMPMRDGHLEFLKTQSAGTQRIGDAVEKMSTAVEKVVANEDEMIRSSVLSKTQADEHLRITVETRDDVREIHAVVVPDNFALPQPTGSKPRTTTTRPK